MLCATMPVTIATIIAVSTEPMILFHSNADIGRPLIPPTTRPATGQSAGKANPARQRNSIITLPTIPRTGHVVAAEYPRYISLGNRAANRASASDHPHPVAIGLDPAAREAVGGDWRRADDRPCLAPRGGGGGG